MYPILFRLHLFGHQIPVYSYGLMLVVCFLACVKVGQWLARNHGIDQRIFTDAVCLALGSGLVGARLCHVIENFRQFTRADLTVWQNLANIVNTREGGLTFYGGLIFATLCCIAFGKYHRVSILLGMDLAAPLVMIGLGIGRIGCFLNGCCYGELCNQPWGVSFPYYSNAYIEQVGEGKISPPPPLTQQTGDGDWRLLAPDSPEFTANPQLSRLAAQSRSLPVQPTQLYSAVTALLLAGILICYLGVPHARGRVFALMMILEGASRYVLELIRVEPAVYTLHFDGRAYGFSTSMVLGLQIFVAGVAMWFLLCRPAQSGRASTPSPDVQISMP
jgi:phosphatidylglycerol:prolipoprotein diacylglycerol transferase